MWPPTTSSELESLIRAGRLVETAAFDAKEKLPTSKELAKDIAAMATEGGIIVIGVGEDANKRLTRECPIRLAGAKETVANIVATCLAEPPTIRISSLPVQQQEDLGYLIILVPQSERAPHMVIVDNDNRYYRRDSAGNRPLLEGEVARIYGQRRVWEIDRNLALTREMERLGKEPSPFVSHLHLICGPVIEHDGLLSILGTDQEVPLKVSGLERLARDPDVAPPTFQKDFNRLSGWSMTVLGAVAGSEDKSLVGYESCLQLGIRYNGNGFLFCDHIATPPGETLAPPKCLDIPQTLGLTRRFLMFMGTFYEAVGFRGQVDVMLGIRGLRGARAWSRSRIGIAIGDREYPEHDYRRGFRASAWSLLDEYHLRSTAMLDPLFRALVSDRWKRLQGLPTNLG